MTINYNDLLTTEQKRSILTQRIAQFASEAYQHSLNRKACENIEDQAGIDSSDKALQVLSSAIAVHQEELDSLPPAAE